MTGRRDSRPWRKRQVQSVEVRQTRSRFSVVRTDNKPRTQNGHIRNDTRDVLRRISGPSNGAICRRMCVARDRACTRMTLQNLHGKEGRRFESVRGLCKSPARRGFFFRMHLHDPQRAVGMEHPGEVGLRGASLARNLQGVQFAKSCDCCRRGCRSRCSG
jgi:hypothetical protein